MESPARRREGRRKNLSSGRDRAGLHHRAGAGPATPGTGLSTRSDSN